MLVFMRKKKGKVGNFGRKKDKPRHQDTKTQRHHNKILETLCLGGYFKKTRSNFLFPSTQNLSQFFESWHNRKVGHGQKR
jgi:hypothetical protein